LVKGEKFWAKLERKENYDLVVGEVVSYVKEPARENITVEFILDFNVLLDFRVDSPRNLPPREDNKLFVMATVDNRLSDDIKKLLSEKLKEITLPFTESLEISGFDLIVALHFWVAHCEVKIQVRSQFEATVPTGKLYQKFLPSKISLEEKLGPLVEAVKEYVVQSLTDGNWFEELVTKKFHIYEKGAKVTLREGFTRTRILNLQVNFLTDGKPYSFSYVRFKIPVTKETGDNLIGMDESELLSTLIVYLSLMREGPYKLGDEEVPLEIEIYYFGGLTFPGDFDELYYSLSNYQKYGLKGSGEQWKES